MKLITFVSKKLYKPMENPQKPKEITFLPLDEYAKLSENEKKQRMDILTETLKQLKKNQNEKK